MPPDDNNLQVTLWFTRQWITPVFNSKNQLYEFDPHVNKVIYEPHVHNNIVPVAYTVTVVCLKLEYQRIDWHDYKAVSKKYPSLCEWWIIFAKLQSRSASPWHLIHNGSLLFLTCGDIQVKTNRKLTIQKIWFFITQTSPDKVLGVF